MLYLQIHTGTLVSPIQSLERYFQDGGVSIIQAAFAHSYFVHPDQVRERTPYYPDHARRSREHYPGLDKGKIATWPGDGRQVRLDDNQRAQMAGIFNTRWHRILAPPRTQTQQRQRTTQHPHLLRVPRGRPRQSLQPPPILRMQSLISGSPACPCPRCAAPPAASSRTHRSHRCSTTPPPATFRTAAEKSHHCGRPPQSPRTAGPSGSSITAVQIHTSRRFLPRRAR